MQIINYSRPHLIFQIINTARPHLFLQTIDLARPHLVLQMINLARVHLKFTGSRRINPPQKASHRDFPPPTGNWAMAEFHPKKEPSQSEPPAMPAFPESPAPDFDPMQRAPTDLPFYEGSKLPSGQLRALAFPVLGPSLPRIRLPTRSVTAAGIRQNTSGHRFSPISWADHRAFW